MAGIAITTADPVPSAGPATTKATSGRAGLFGDALGAAVSDSDQGSADPTPDVPATGTSSAAGSVPSDASGSAAPQPSLPAAAAALAGMVGRAIAGLPGSASPVPSAATAAGAPATGPVAGAAGDGSALVLAATAGAPDAAPGSAKPGAKPGHDDAADASATPTDPAALTSVLPPTVPVVPRQTVAAPQAAPRESRVGAAGRPAAAADPRNPDATPADLSATGSPSGSAPTPAAPADGSGASATPAPGPDASAVAALAPVQQIVPTASTIAPQPVAPSLGATTDPTVAQQLQGPLLSLRSAPDGDHVMVVRISPEHLGSVTVHATVSRGDLTVQLVASTSGGHDALQSMMTDLRRDLGAGDAGTATTLSLSTGDAPQQDQRGQQTWVGTGAGGSQSGGSPGQDDRLPRTTDARPTDDPVIGFRLSTSGSALLDVLA